MPCSQRRKQEMPGRWRNLRWTSPALKQPALDLLGALGPLGKLCSARLRVTEPEPEGPSGHRLLISNRVHIDFLKRLHGAHGECISTHRYAFPVPLCGLVIGRRQWADSQPCQHRRPCRPGTGNRAAQAMASLLSLKRLKEGWEIISVLC